MAIGTRRIKRFRENRDSGAGRTHEKPEPVVNSKDEEVHLAFQELESAKKRFQKAVYNKRHKITNREELTRAGKTIFKGAGRMVDDFFDGASRIGESVERDIRKHSIQGKIDDTIIRALMEKNKKGSSKTTSKRPKIWVEVPDANGKPTFINVKDIPAALRRRGR
jgi:hypothetical protein